MSGGAAGPHTDDAAEPRTDDMAHPRTGDMADPRAGERRPLGRRRLGFALLTVVALAGGGVAVTALVTPERPSADRTDAKGRPPTTAPVTRGDLADSSRRDGTLGHLGERKINAGGPGGTLTWIAPPGSVVKRDERLYEVDGEAVRLMYGDEPMYRTLKTGDTGRDVRQLEENLAALGYTGFDVDEEYTAKTAAAVGRWQKSHDLKRTGTVGPDRIAFAGSAVRVREAGAGSGTGSGGGERIAPGDRVAPGSPVLTVTGSERVVSFEVPAAEAGSAKPGTRVRVTLPDGTRLPGKVSAVGRTAKAGDDPQDKTPKIDVTVSFDDPAGAKGVDQSPVTVELTGETRRDVLSVPVNALLALPDGGFGVQVVENGTARDVRVELGMFAQGRVEITGAGLREGMRVGVPS
ncbi:multidrug efflux pump subunit AcrA (membrane-fusion protein) [Streptomyces sp. PanSC19]|uniref:peptidoglycan-binding protein n=1 Tax=Streptomyces sp. PanSC19 TaxID=1520455 RepID=UPI000F491373|nr:peptidoglycan-binding protein [Streptomyces sp. PanSC19]ROQ23475.1 multidrug efflux pump subunit AcrA (membrane-fusion protein) [Streptomyces sp. PanSC19]